MQKPSPIKPYEIRELLEKQGYRCAVTGRELTPDTASIDHILPLARGGEHAASNIWLVEYRVNLAKGTMTYEEFVELCRGAVSMADAAKNN